MDTRADGFLIKFFSKSCTYVHIDAFVVQN